MLEYVELEDILLPAVKSVANTDAVAVVEACIRALAENGLVKVAGL